MEAADDWIVAIVAVLAVLISVAAFLYSRRATIAAERSTAVTERQEQRQLEEAAERAVRWRFAAEPQVFFANTQPRWPRLRWFAYGCLAASESGLCR
jgi:Flp pilus assembly protein TadB